jgi:predicted transcriptional regulator
MTKQIKKKKPETASISFKLDPKQKKRVAEIAKQLGYSTSGLLGYWVDQILDSMDRESKT